MNPVAKAINKALGRNVGEIGRCTYTVTSSNDVAPKVREIKNDEGEVTGLGVMPNCRCGETLGEFILDDPTSQIVEEMLETRKLREETGKSVAYAIGLPKTIVTRCPRCGREVSVTVIFNLDKPMQNKFFERHEKASESFLYGDALKLEVSVDGGYFRETRSPRELQDIVNPLCNCGQTLYPKNLRQTIENMIEKVTQFFENDEIRDEIKPVKTKDAVKCAFCLLEVAVRAKITPTLPNKKDGVGEIVRRYKSWQNRFKT